MEEKKRQTYSKKLMTIYSIAIIIWITWSYMLATLGYTQIAQELSSNVVIVGVASILGYFGKSFFETREEEKNKLEREKMENASVPSTLIEEEEEDDDEDEEGEEDETVEKYIMEE